MRTEKGAEATVEIGEGQVVKKRPEKKYRHEQLDEKIRKERTETEKNLLSEANKYGVNVPEVKKKDASTLELEKIEGETLKNKVENKPELLEKLGENISLLHSIDIIHGDLTTSNAIVKDSEVFLIDFGLAFRSQRTEDQAVDIHLLKQVLESSHPEAVEDSWESFLEGYREYENSEEVLEQLEEVEQRGRYK
ncbi:MAG: Kae1-associated kinase Bud32 [Nanohaloarchaea archaeon QH_8_44_6]|nr:MAG: Kae1-associated kinase Bud32 [Nanohaloarchaea archaeon QH_8_44_6]